MKKLYLPITMLDTEPAPADLYMPSSYPNDGIWLTPISMQLYARINNTVTYTGSMLPGIRDLAVESLEPKPSHGGFSENFMLKAMAVAQDPTLAINFCGEAK